jgi:hypothetical protein
VFENTMLLSISPIRILFIFLSNGRIGSAAGTDEPPPQSPRGTFLPVASFSRRVVFTKKGTPVSTGIPFGFKMVPKGGLDRLSLGLPGHLPWRRGFPRYPLKVAVVCAGFAVRPTFSMLLRQKSHHPLR